MTLTPYSELADVIDALPMLCREKRRREGLSQRAAARQIGIAFATVSRFEAGKGAHLDNAVAILRWLDGADMTTHPQHPGEWADRCRIHASEGSA